MPRRFSKTILSDSEIDPRLVGYGDIPERRPEPEYTHRHPVTGALCDCHYGNPNKDSVAKVAAKAEPPSLKELKVMVDLPMPTWQGDYRPLDVGGAIEQGLVTEEGVAYIVEKLDNLTGAIEIELERQGYTAVGKQVTPDQAKEIAAVIGGTYPPRVENVPVVEGQTVVNELIAPGGALQLTEKEIEPLLDKLAKSLVEEVGAKIMEAAVPQLETDAGRRIKNENQKIFRPGGPLSKQEGGNFYSGPQTLKALDTLVNDWAVPQMLPWLVSLVKKGEIGLWGGSPYGGQALATKPSPPSYPSGRTMDSILDPRGAGLADWFAAKQSPYRKGINAADLTLDQAVDLALQHGEWLHSKAKLKQYKEEIEAKEKEKRAFDANGVGGDGWTQKQVYDMPDVVAELNQKIESGVLDPEDYSYVLDRVTLNPEDYKGWKVVKIEDASDAELETAILDHCIGQDGQPYKRAIDEYGVEAYSLRDESGVPKVSWHFNPEDSSEGPSLAHVQGRSGYPQRQDFRDMISLFNIATSHDDDGGGKGSEVHLGEHYGFDEYDEDNYTWSWDFGEFRDIADALEAAEEPWVVADMQGAENLHEECEFEGRVDPDEIAEEALRAYEGWPDDLMNHFLHGEYLWNMDLDDYIEALIPQIESMWINDYDHECPGCGGEGFDDEEPCEKCGGQPDQYEEEHRNNIDASALQEMVNDGLLDPRIAAYIEKSFLPGEEVSLEDPNNRLGPHERLRNQWRAIEDSEGTRDYERFVNEYAKEFDEPRYPGGPPRGTQSERERLEGPYNSIWGDRRAVPPEKKRWRAQPQAMGTPHPFDQFPLDPSQTVLLKPGGENTDFRTLDQNPEAHGFNQRRIMPRDNPALIAEHYWRIMHTEGQEAANEWYRQNYPDAPMTSVQLTSSWNDRMRWSG